MLDDKYKLYKQLLKQDEHGFIESHKCDSLLFTGLVGCVPDIDMDIMAAFEPVSKTWRRRPHEHSCYPDGSPSTISRDMFVGLAWYCWKHDRKDIADEIVKFALSHWMIMGEATDFKTKIARCFLGFGLLGTFAMLSSKYKWLSWLPVNVPGAPVMEGYQAHLQVLHRLLRHKIKGTDPSKDKMIQAQAKRQPKNPLFNAAIGKKNEALNVLGNTKYWPADRLPKSKDRHEPWLPMRDIGSDWEPSGSGHIHSGGDFLFCYGLLNGDI